MKRKPLNLQQALGHEASDKRLAILRKVGELGSISEAARAVGVSYKAAWQAIDTLSNLARQPLVDKVVGGSGGGGAQLTAAGERLLEAADELTRSREEVLKRLSAQPNHTAGPTGWLGLPLRCSIRNQLPCTLAQLTPASGGAVTVRLQLPDGSALNSRITAESAELLALTPGMPVLALIKATAVAITRQAARAKAGSSLLRGSIQRTSSAPGGKELTLRLPCGSHLSGFVRSSARFAIGDAAVAQVDEAAVAIGLAG